MAFTKKLIEFEIQLASNTQTNQPNTFSESGSDSVKIKGVRTNVRIQNSGAPSSSAAQIDIFGLSTSLMNQLSTLGMIVNLIGRNTITITAGDDDSGLSTVFSGTIVNAYADLNASPNVPFRIEAQSGLANATINAPATSFNGTTDVATLMSGFARQMNLGFENNGVDVKLSNPYYAGGVLAQMRRCAADAGINADIVNGNILAIWPKFGARTSLTIIPVIAAPPKGTMIGYPSFTQQGIMVRDLFNPKVAFGGRVKVETTNEAVEKANGTWVVTKLDLALDSLQPRGQWMSTIYCYADGLPHPILPPP